MSAFPQLNRVKIGVKNNQVALSNSLDDIPAHVRRHHLFIAVCKVAKQVPTLIYIREARIGAEESDNYATTLTVTWSVDDCQFESEVEALFSSFGESIAPEYKFKSVKHQLVNE